jgi:adhesin transport system outer membrane protein
MSSARGYLLIASSIFALAGCQGVELPDVKALNPLQALEAKAGEVDTSSAPAEAATLPSLVDMIGTAGAKVNVDAGFKAALSAAVKNDPRVIAAASELEARRASARLTASGKEFNFDATVLGGVEDVTDETAGVAAILKANRVMFDGGQLDAKIEADGFAVRAAEAALDAARNERGVRLTQAWIELERYRALQDLIDSRLSILEPLLLQLEKVAESGVGDMSMVASAQRTVSLIRVTQTDVAEKLAQAEVAFRNGFGTLPSKASYNADLISKAVPSGKIKKLAETAPALLAEYYGYRSAEANVAAVKALDKFNVAFEAKLQRPFADSTYDSDESVGLVLTKKFHRGDQLRARVENAEAAAASQADRVRSTFRDGEQAVNSARQMISSMDKAIQLALENAQITRDEIDYLRKQLIIGGSTLESVLSAEAQLYDAEAKEIGFIAERRKAEVTILGVTGKLAPALGL